MKNIHVLPTDKPSRLFIYDGSLGFAKGFQYGSYAISNQHIYITSDEEIKEGDWYLDTFNSQKIKANECSDHKHYVNSCKKIILTTDQDLIKDGVQAIDDKFLEWFVKNPICDEIEIEKRKLLQGTTFYKIIIPKEEPKQDEIIYFQKGKKYIQQDGVVILAGEKETNGMVIIDPKNGYGIGHYSKTWNPKAFKLYIEPKQETPEEETLSKIKFVLSCNNDAQAIRLLEQYGQWQQERSYSEEEVFSIIDRVFHMYASSYRQDAKDWFEKYKKK